MITLKEEGFNWVHDFRKSSPSWQEGHGEAGWHRSQWAEKQRKRNGAIGLAFSFFPFSTSKPTFHRMLPIFMEDLHTTPTLALANSLKIPFSISWEISNLTQLTMKMNQQRDTTLLQAYMLTLLLFPWLPYPCVHGHPIPASLGIQKFGQCNSMSTSRDYCTDVGAHRTAPLTLYNNTL